MIKSEEAGKTNEDIDMSEAKVSWVACTVENGIQKHHGGELAPYTGQKKWVDIETELFAEMNKLENSYYVMLQIEYPDGSGSYRVYEKRGEIWLKVNGDNLVPTWFGYIFFGLFCLLILACIICACLGVGR